MVCRSCSGLRRRGEGNETSHIGTTGLVPRGGPGLVFNLVNQNVNQYLNALSNKEQMRTLATPKLLTLENQEATTNSATG